MKARLYTQQVGGIPRLSAPARQCKSSAKAGKMVTHIPAVGQLRARLDAVITILRRHHLHRAGTGPDKLDVEEVEPNVGSVWLLDLERVLGQTYTAKEGDN